MSIKAALRVGGIVKHKIEEEIHKHQQHQQQHQHEQKKPSSETSADAVGGADVGEDDEINDGANGVNEKEGEMAAPTLETDLSKDEQSNKSPSRGDHYFSDDSTAT